LVGSSLYLNSLRNRESPLLAKGDNIVGNCIIDPSAEIHPDALIGPDVTIGANCKVEAGARLKNTCVMSKCHIKAHAWISGSIIGWYSTVGKWARVEPCTVTGEDV
jgi:mannose-1-phosphate guanylyltransferase